MLQSKDTEWQTGLKKKKKQETIICSLQEDQLRAKDTQTENKGMEKDISGKWK